MQLRRSLVRRVLTAAAVTGGILPAARSFAHAEHRSQAPDFVGIDGWLNTAAPLTVEELRGKVVLLGSVTGLSS